MKIIALFIICLALFGCSQTATQTSDLSGEAPSSIDLSEIEDIASELDDSDLANLESDLADLDW